MGKPSLVVMVVEDGLHKQLVNRYLKRRGLRPHAIRMEISPSGDASAWVRKRFAKEVCAYRSRQAQTALIVVIDADIGTVEARLRQLDQSLNDAHMKHLELEKEQIARLIPKRNVETWILCLNGQTVDEETDYKKRNDWNALIPPAAEILCSWTQKGDTQSDHCVDSLRLGVKELKRLRL